MSAAVSTVRVSRATLEELGRFQRALQARTADEAISRLLKTRRGELIDALYGSAKGKVKRFTERDRIDGHH